jgi:Holliday junction resolvase RusA-like endonuclease
MALNQMSCHQGNIEITITFAFKGGNIGDIDNLCKTVLDGLQGACYFNDSQVKELSASIIVAEEDYILIGVVFK